MGTIGCFGPLIFMVSANAVLTYSEIEETCTGRWANHETVNGSVLSEFLGPGQEEKSFKMIFAPMLGVHPDTSYNMLRELTRAGEHFPVILANTPLSNTDWYIDSIESTSKTFSPLDGMILWRECTVAVKEYQ